MTSYTATHHRGIKGRRQYCKHPTSIAASLFSRAQRQSQTETAKIKHKAKPTDIGIEWHTAQNIYDGNANYSKERRRRTAVSHRPPAVGRYTEVRTLRSGHLTGWLWHQTVYTRRRQRSSGILIRCGKDLRRIVVDPPRLVASDGFTGRAVKSSPVEPRDALILKSTVALSPYLESTLVNLSQAISSSLPGNQNWAIRIQFQLAYCLTLARVENSVQLHQPIMFFRGLSGPVGCVRVECDVADIKQTYPRQAPRLPLTASSTPDKPANRVYFTLYIHTLSQNKQFSLTSLTLSQSQVSFTAARHNRIFSCGSPQRLAKQQMRHQR